MVDALSIRNKINTRVFDNLGSTALWSSRIEGSTDKFGDRTDAQATDTSIIIVPWGHMYSNEEYYPFGQLLSGEVDIAFRYDQSLNIGDRITYNSKLYKVKVIEYYTLKDILLVKVARLKEII